MEDEEEDFDFEYEDDDDDQNNQEGEEDGSEVDLENRYYNAKGKKEDAPEEALAEFRGVVEKEKETEMGEWWVGYFIFTLLLFYIITHPGSLFFKSNLGASKR